MQLLDLVHREILRFTWCMCHVFAEAAMPRFHKIKLWKEIATIGCAELCTRSDELRHIYRNYVTKDWKTIASQLGGNLQDKIGEENEFWVGLMLGLRQWQWSSFRKVEASTLLLKFAKVRSPVAIFGNCMGGRVNFYWPEGAQIKKKRSSLLFLKKTIKSEFWFT